jgi:hypothetical protein
MGQYQYPLPPVPRGRNWFERNWKWLVPVGCLPIILTIVAAVALIVGLVFGMIRSSDVCQEAVARAKSNPAVIAALGQPIEEGFLVTGSIHTENSSGEADLSIPISGPKGSAKIYAEARKSAEKWEFTVLHVVIEGRAERVDLLAK